MPTTLLLALADYRPPAPILAPDVAEIRADLVERSAVLRYALRERLPEMAAWVECGERLAMQGLPLVDVALRTVESAGAPLDTADLGEGVAVGQVLRLKRPRRTSE